MDADKEHIKRLQEKNKPLHPSLRLDNMLDNEIVARACQSRKALVKPVKKGRAHLRPQKVSTFQALRGQHFRVPQMVN